MRLHETNVAVHSLFILSSACGAAGEVSHNSDLLVDLVRWVRWSVLLGKESGASGPHHTGQKHGSSADPVTEHGWNRKFVCLDLVFKACTLAENDIWVEQVARVSALVDAFGIFLP